MPGVTLDLLEWHELTPDTCPTLSGLTLAPDRAAQALADQLTRLGMLEIVELRTGLSIRATSFIGRIRLGDLQITVRPKIQHDILLSLFRHAYNLRDLKLFAEADHRSLPLAFQDLLISQLVAEVSELLARGLHRQYVQVQEALVAPRGRLDIQRLARQGGIYEASAPCIHYPRLEDRLVNQVVLAGLHLAVCLTDDLVLRARLRRLAAVLAETVSPIRLSADVMRRLDRELSRLTVAYEPALTLIALLLESAGITLEDDVTSLKLPGFLFDMNRFFEALMSRFLHENLPDCTVQDQYRLHGMLRYAPEHNPQRRHAPTPRPDYVVKQDGKVLALLDAKYRNIWEKGLPRDMLYQMAMYALSQGAEGRATILYPTVEPLAKQEVIEIRETVYGEHRAQVVLRPVQLPQLERLLRLSGVQAKRQVEKFARHLAFGEPVLGV
ncbi:MAG: restriction endonuclease [Chloroflexi bacterium]|nr:restriction endonuclease [Chloroflexota bacterium]